jgi:septation ring formation regulator EzrA
MEKLNELRNFLFNKKNYTTVIMLVVVLFAVVYFSTLYTVPKFQEWQSELSDTDTKQNEYQNLLSQKQRKDLEAKRNSTRVEKVPVKIYKSKKAGLPRFPKNFFRAWRRLRSHQRFLSGLRIWKWHANTVWTSGSS